MVMELKLMLRMPKFKHRPKYYSTQSAQITIQLPGLCTPSLPFGIPKPAPRRCILSVRLEQHDRRGRGQPDGQTGIRSQPNPLRVVRLTLRGRTDLKS